MENELQAPNPGIETFFLHANSKLELGELLKYLDES